VCLIFHLLLLRYYVTYGLYTKTAVDLLPLHISVIRAISTLKSRWLQSSLLTNFTAEEAPMFHQHGVANVLQDRGHDTCIGKAVREGIRGCVQKFTDWPTGARTANGTALCYYAQLYRYFVSQSSEFCRHNPLCFFSTTNTEGKRIFLYDSVRKLLDKPSYIALFGLI
jgi:hypothetical protein